MRKLSKTQEQRVADLIAYLRGRDTMPKANDVERDLGWHFGMLNNLKACLVRYGRYERKTLPGRGFLYRFGFYKPCHACGKPTDDIEFFEIKSRTGVVPERYMAIKAAYESEPNMQKIGAAYGISRERVRQILEAQGVTGRMDGTAIKRERREANAAYAAKRKAALKAEREALYDKVVEAYREGKTYAEMAATFGKSTTSWIAAVLHARGELNRRRNAYNPKRKLTDDERAQIASRYAAGESRLAIARDFDVSPWSVYHIAIRMGAYRPITRQRRAEAGTA